MGLVCVVCSTTFAQLPMPSGLPSRPVPMLPPDAENRSDWWAGPTLVRRAVHWSLSSGWSSPTRRRSGSAVPTVLAEISHAHGQRGDCERAGGGFAPCGRGSAPPRRGQGGFRSRAGHVLQMTLLARYRDAHGFAYARLIGNVGGNVTQNFGCRPAAEELGRSPTTSAWASRPPGFRRLPGVRPDVRKRIFKK